MGLRFTTMASNDLGCIIKAASVRNFSPPFPDGRTDYSGAEDTDPYIDSCRFGTKRHLKSPTIRRVLVAPYATPSRGRA
jgi:hypothetical protein